MANSLHFNSVDLSTYGLIVQRVGWPMVHGTTPIQLHDKAIAYNSYKQPITIPVIASIKANTTVQMRSYIDSIRAMFNQAGDVSLRFDLMGDRYWLSRLESMNGVVIGPNMWQGDLSFLCLDPVAFSVAEIVEGPTLINAPPQTVPVVVGGTNRTKPVYSFKAKNDAVGTFISVENDETGDKIEWTGDVLTNKIVEVDCEYWIVSYDGTEDMKAITGEFPELLPGQNNDLIIDTVSAFEMTVTYRNRYR